jgi:hypothetical protein
LAFTGRTACDRRTVLRSCGIDWSSVAQYQGDRIRYFYDHYSDGMSDEINSWTRAYAPNFSGSYT